MSVAYDLGHESGFENRTLETQYERARLTRLLTLQQDLLTHVMEAGGRGLSPDAMVEKVRSAFDADGLVVALDKPATATDSASSSSERVQIAQLHRSNGVSMELAEQLGRMRAFEGRDGPVRQSELVEDQNFTWFWSQEIGGVAGPNGQTSNGRIIFLFEEKHTPTSEDHLAMKSVGPHINMVLHSIMQDKAIAFANDRFARLASTIPGVVYQRRVRPDGDIRYTYISESAEELFGVSANEILTNPSALFASYAPEYGDTFRKRLLEASRNMTIWDVEASIVMPTTGEIKYTHAIARPEKEPDGSVLWTGVILDSTRMKLAEQAAAATEASTRRAIVENLPQGFILFDANDKLILRNGHFDTTVPKFAEAAFEGADYVDLVRTELQVGADAAANEEELDARLEERLARHRSETYFSVERRLDEENWLLISEKRTTDGGTVVLFTNINEIKQQEQVLQHHAERLERANGELQQFAYVASHDLQEPLRKIEAFGDRLVTRCSDQLDERGKLYTDRMMDASGRMRQLINDLLSYSRVGTQDSEKSMVDLTLIVRDVIIDLDEVVAEKSGRIEFGELKTIQADHTQMRQLFQNLLSNSIKYSDPERSPVVEITCETLPDNMIQLEVKDNGIGFEQQYAERIFEVFQRLHGRSEYAGTGIGLATVRRIIEQHNGKISVVSEPGVGTVFSVALPIEQLGDLANGEDKK